jgi:hypothetical protein
MLFPGLWHCVGLVRTDVSVGNESVVGGLEVPRLPSELDTVASVQGASYCV